MNTTLMNKVKEVLNKHASNLAIYQIDVTTIANYLERGEKHYKKQVELDTRQLWVFSAYHEGCQITCYELLQDYLTNTGFALYDESDLYDELVAIVVGE